MWSVFWDINISLNFFSLKGIFKVTYLTNLLECVQYIFNVYFVGDNHDHVWLFKYKYVQQNMSKPIV